jgi:hypothetical protein
VPWEQDHLSSARLDATNELQRIAESNESGSRDSPALSRSALRSPGPCADPAAFVPDTKLSDRWGENSDLIARFSRH